MSFLRWIFQYVFSCHHRHLSRVFTIDKHTYQVCFKCAQQVEYPRKPFDFSRNRADDTVAPSTSSKRIRPRAN